MNHYHAVVWLDHAQAKVFHFDAHDFERSVVKPEHAGTHLHHKAGSGDSGHAAEDPKYHAAIEAVLADAQEILVLGPGSAKTAFHKHAAQHAPAVAKKIVAVENSDHPTDGEIVGYARKHFKTIDKMTPQLS